MTSRIVRLRPEDRLTAVGGIDRGTPAATVRPDHYTIPAIIVRLGSQRLSLNRASKLADMALRYRFIIGKPNWKPCWKGRGKASRRRRPWAATRGRVPTVRKQDRPGEHLSRAGRSYRREWTLGPDAVKATYARSSLFDQRKGLMEHRAKHFGVVSRERL